jgi:hypothetical protein
MAIMSDTGKFKTADGLAELHGLEESQREGRGRIEYDELGNAVWVPYGGLGSKETLQLLLNDQSLALTENGSKGTTKRIEQNAGGLKKGYDPYDSGMLVKKQWKKKKDLRALSKWIEQKKKLEDDR